MFHNRKQQNTEEEPTHYYRNVASYRSYEEVVASKRRRSRFRRGFTALALVLAVGSMGAYWLLGDELCSKTGSRTRAAPAKTLPWRSNPSPATKTAGLWW